MLLDFIFEILNLFFKLKNIKYEDVCYLDLMDFFLKQFSQQKKIFQNKDTTIIKL